MRAAVLAGAEPTVEAACPARSSNRNPGCRQHGRCHCCRWCPTTGSATELSSHSRCCCGSSRAAELRAAELQAAGELREAVTAEVADRLRRRHKNARSSGPCLLRACLRISLRNRCSRAQSNQKRRDCTRYSSYNCSQPRWDLHQVAAVAAMVREYHHRYKTPQWVVVATAAEAAATVVAARAWVAAARAVAARAGVAAATVAAVGGCAGCEGGESGACACAARVYAAHGCEPVRIELLLLSRNRRSPRSSSHCLRSRCCNCSHCSHSRPSRPHPHCCNSCLLAGTRRDNG